MPAPAIAPHMHGHATPQGAWALTRRLLQIRRLGSRPEGLPPSLPTLQRFRAPSSRIPVTKIVTPLRPATHQSTQIVHGTTLRPALRHEIVHEPLTARDFRTSDVLASCTSLEIRTSDVLAWRTSLEIRTSDVSESLTDRIAVTKIVQRATSVRGAPGNRTRPRNRRRPEKEGARAIGPAGERLSTHNENQEQGLGLQVHHL